MGETGNLVLNQMDYEGLQSRIIEVISHTLAKKDSMVFEDKVIIDNSLNLWVGCLQHHIDLFDVFIGLTNVSAVEFLTEGLLYCKHDGVRE